MGKLLGDSEDKHAMSGFRKRTEHRFAEKM